MQTFWFFWIGRNLDISEMLVYHNCFITIKAHAIKQLFAFNLNISTQQRCENNSFLQIIILFMCALWKMCTELFPHKSLLMRVLWWDRHISRSQLMENTKLGLSHLFLIEILYDSVSNEDLLTPAMFSIQYKTPLRLMPSPYFHRNSSCCSEQTTQLILEIKKEKRRVECSCCCCCYFNYKWNETKCK